MDMEGEYERAKHGGDEKAMQQEGGDRGGMGLQYGTPP